MAANRDTPQLLGPLPDWNGHPRPGFWARIFGRRSRDNTRLQAWRRLAMNLRLDLGSSPGPRVLLLTSPTFSQASGQATMQLAHFLAADSGHRVLVVDGNCGGGGLSQAFGAGDRSGFLNLLDGTAGSLSEVVVGTSHDDVAFLPVGHTSAGATGLIAGPGLAALLENARQGYDDLLVHTGSVLEDASTLAFPPLVDAVLLLVVEGQTRVEELDESERILSACQARRVGLVLAKPSR